MAMTTVHVHDVLRDIAHDVHTSTIKLSLAVGAGAVDPELIAPRDRQEDQQVEERIAFRCSCL
ncbi:MAG: hypothetical protein WD826_01555 [Actinomycetota bacterium]